MSAWVVFGFVLASILRAFTHEYLADHAADTARDLLDHTTPPYEWRDRAMASQLLAEAEHRRQCAVWWTGAALVFFVIEMAVLAQ